MPPINRPLPGKRVAVVRRPLTAAKSQPRLTKKQWGILVVAILIVGTVAVWASGILSSSDSRVAEINEMWAKVKDVPAAEQWERRREIGHKQAELPAADQQKLRDDMMARRVNELLRLPPEKRTAEIDKQLDRFVAMQQAFGGSQNGGGGQGNAQRAGGLMFGGGGGGGANANAGRNRWLSQIPASSKAAWTQWGQLMQARAAQRGITMPNWGR